MDSVWKELGEDKAGQKLGSTFLPSKGPGWAVVVMVSVSPLAWLDLCCRAPGDVWGSPGASHRGREKHTVVCSQNRVVESKGEHITASHNMNEFQRLGAGNRAHPRLHSGTLESTWSSSPVLDVRTVVALNRQRLGGDTRGCWSPQSVIMHRAVT